jgi:hypothetical protein
MIAPEERGDIVRGLDVLRNIIENVGQSPLAPLLPTTAQNFTLIAGAAIELAKGLVGIGHEDPAGELDRLRGRIEEAWQASLIQKFSSTR